MAGYPTTVKYATGFHTGHAKMHIFKSKILRKEHSPRQNHTEVGRGTDSNFLA